VRPCPFCAEQIQPNAILCRWCGLRVVPIPVTPQAAANSGTPWARASLVLGGLLIGVSPVLPWARVVLLGDLSLVQISPATVSPITPIALVVLGAAGITGGLLARPTRVARTTAAILGSASAILTGTLLVQFLRLSSQAQSLANTGFGPWIAVLGTGVTVLGATIPTAQPSKSPTGPVAPSRVPPSRSQHTVVMSSASAVIVAGVIAAILVGGSLRAPTLSSSPATPPPPELVRTSVPAMPSAQVLHNYSLPGSTTTAAPTAPGATGNTDFIHAESIVAAHGYTPDSNSQWARIDGLNGITATATGSADSYDRRAFFFYGNSYLGTDAPQASADVGETWSTSDTVALSYRLYKPSDPACCFTAGSALVRFHWDGSRLRALDIIPSADGDAAYSRR
jgi:hypothetical protein